MAPDDLQDEVFLTVMVFMTLADGRVADDEVTRMQWIHGKSTGREVTEQDVRAVIARVRKEKIECRAYLATIGDKLSLTSKRTLLKAAFAIASADGRVLDAEDALMVQLARALSIPPEVYCAVISHMMVATEFT